MYYEYNLERFDDYNFSLVYKTSDPSIIFEYQFKKVVGKGTPYYSKIFYVFDDESVLADYYNKLWDCHEWVLVDYNYFKQYLYKNEKEKECK